MRRVGLFSFECKRTWESLDVTDDPQVRSCSECQRSVHRAHGVIMALEHAAAGRCVALIQDGGTWGPATKTVGRIGAEEGFPKTAWLVALEGPRQHETIELTRDLLVDGVAVARGELVDGDQLTIAGTRYVFKTID